MGFACLCSTYASWADSYVDWQGLRANLTRLYNTVSEESFLECKSQHKYQKLLFALIYFHSVLLERRKFRSVGLNIPYDFNDTDYKVNAVALYGVLMTKAYHC